MGHVERKGTVWTAPPLAAWALTVSTPWGLTNTAPARAAFEQKFYDEVDPDGTLDPGEADKRVRHAKSLYYERLARKRWKR